MCGDCWREVHEFAPPLCPRCGVPVSASTRGTDTGTCEVCHREPLAQISRAASLGAYDGALRGILHALKFRRCPTLARALALRMREVRAEVLAGADAVVPVPLHPARRRERGFNQALVLARHLGPPVMIALRRTRRTDSQASLDARARHRNVTGAFALSRHQQWTTRVERMLGDRARLLTPRTVFGLRVVLVDDVWTTGATLSACAMVLMEAGAREVRALTVARTLPGPHRNRQP